MGHLGGCEDYANNESWCDLDEEDTGFDAGHCCICMHRHNFEPVGCGAWNATACVDDPSVGNATAYYFDGSLNECFRTENATDRIVVDNTECCQASNGTDDLYAACAGSTPDIDPNLAQYAQYAYAGCDVAP